MEKINTLRELIIIATFMVLIPFFAVMGAGSKSDDTQLEERSFNKKLMQGRRGKVLSSVASKTTEWDRKENFVNSWNIDRSPYIQQMYRTPSYSKKKSILLSDAERFADAMIKDEAERRKNEDGDDRLFKAQNSLVPTGSLLLNKENNIDIKFKAEVLRAKGKMEIETPIVNSEIAINVKGDWNIETSKTLKNMGVVSKVNYHDHGRRWDFITAKDLNENWQIVASSRNNTRPDPVSITGDKGLALLFQKPF